MTMRTALALTTTLLFAASCRATSTESTASPSPRELTSCTKLPALKKLAAGEHTLSMASEVDSHRLQALVQVPTGTPPDDGWPLVLFLHGAGERGDDLDLVRVHGPPKLVDTTPELARAVVVSPQCPRGSFWRPAPLMSVVAGVRARVPLDPDRFYVTGLSMGGGGTWDLLATYPDVWAAAIPICGVRQKSLWKTRREDLLRAEHVPVRSFHGDADRVVPADESIFLFDRLREEGWDIELTLYPGVRHDSWTETYANAELWEWLFAQRRVRR